MKLYREVKANKRVPGEGEHMTNEGWVEYDYEESLWMFLNSYGEWVIVDNVIWWLEPIEITEEEIRKEMELTIDFLDRGGPGKSYAITRCAKAILSKLKGDGE